MKYAFVIYNNGWARDVVSGDELKRVEDAFLEVLALPNVSVPVRLQGVETATTVRVENGKALLTDGPFVDSKEFLGGLFLFEGANLDEAIDVAARLQAARPGGAIEVRPIADRPG